MLPHAPQRRNLRKSPFAVRRLVRNVTAPLSQTRQHPTTDELIPRPTPRGVHPPPRPCPSPPRTPPPPPALARPAEYARPRSRSPARRARAPFPARATRTRTSLPPRGSPPCGPYTSAERRRRPPTAPRPAAAHR